MKHSMLKPILRKPLTQIRKVLSTTKLTIVRKQYEKKCLRNAKALVQIYENGPYNGLKIGRLEANGLGQIILYAEMHLRHISCLGLNPLNEVVLVAPSNSANPVLLKMYSRVVKIIQDDHLYTLLTDGGMRYLEDIGAALPDRYRNGQMFLPDYSSGIKLTEQETIEAKAVCRTIGLNPDQRFVLLSTRDDYYWEGFRKIKNDINNYRNSSFNSFAKAIQWLNKEGFQIARVGHYAHVDNQSLGYISTSNLSNSARDLLDVFLHSRCEFAACGGSGIMYYPYLFKRPILAHNAIPIGNNAPILGGVVVPRRIIRSSDKSTFSFKQLVNLRYEVIENYHPRIISGDLFSGDSFYKFFGLETVENSEQELFAAITEIVKQISGNLRLSEDDEEQQFKFRNCFPVGHTMRHFKGITSPSFLKNYPETIS